LRKEQMLSYLPPYERKSKVFQDYFQDTGQELDQRDIVIEDLKKQFSIDTATWGLDAYEKELGIKTDYNKSYDERRSVIKSRWRGVGKVDRVLIDITAEAYSNGEVDVFFTGQILVRFVGTRGIPPNLDDLKEVIEDIKPAHLRVLYEFTYLNFGELAAAQKTFADIAIAGLNFQTFSTWKPT